MAGGDERDVRLLPLRHEIAAQKRPPRTRQRTTAQYQETTGPLVLAASIQRQEISGRQVPGVVFFNTLHRLGYLDNLLIVFLIEHVSMT